MTGDQDFDVETLSQCWELLGSYIARHMRAGKGVHVHKLGTFTFTSPEFDLTVSAACSLLYPGRDQPR